MKQTNCNAVTERQKTTFLHHVFFNIIQLQRQRHLLKEPILVQSVSRLIN